MMIRRGRFLLAFLAAALICSSIALGGSATTASKTIKACVNKKTGVVRVSSKCKKGEKKVVWNVRGNAGAKGASGAPGQSGAQGAKGDPGQNGVNGNAGATGATGDAGATGALGAKGDKGDTGAQGATGPAGAA